MGPLGELCPKSRWSTGKLNGVLLLSILIISSGKALAQSVIMLSTPSVLTAGKHNTTSLTACTGFNPSLLTFTTATSGGQLPYEYQWQLNNTAIAGATLSSYDPAQLTTAGLYSYNCAITDAAGTVVYTTAKLITILQDPSVSVSGGGSHCAGTPVTLYSAVSEGTGGIAFQWQSSADNIAFTNIPGATGPTYSPETATSGTLFYRVIINPSVGSCNNATSPPAEVTIQALPVTSMIYHL